MFFFVTSAFGKSIIGKNAPQGTWQKVILSRKLKQNLDTYYNVIFEINCKKIQKPVSSQIPTRTFVQYPIVKYIKILDR